MRYILLACLLTAGVAAPQGTEYPAIKYRSNYLASYYVSHAPTTTPCAPCWSPDGKWIVYTADDNWRSIQLEILNVESGQTRPLTRDAQVYLDQVFSPDGGRLAFVSTEFAGH